MRWFSLAFVCALLMAIAMAEDSKRFDAVDSQRPTLAEWVDSSLGGVSAKTAGSIASNRHHLEKDYACYKMASKCGLDDYPYTFWSALSCCPTNDKDQTLFDNLAAGTSMVGRCFMSRGFALINNEPPNGPTSVMGENFLVTCFLKEDADSCSGPSGCGDIVVTAQGVSLLPIRAISEGDPGLPTNACDDAFRHSSPGQQGSNSPSQANTTTGSSGARTLLQDPAPRVWATQAWLFTGPMTVTSRKFETKWERGWFELILPTNPEGWLTLADLEAEEAAQGWKYPRIPLEDFYKYKLEFFRKEEPQY